MAVGQKSGKIFSHCIRNRTAHKHTCQYSLYYSYFCSVNLEDHKLPLGKHDSFGLHAGYATRMLEK